MVKNKVCLIVIDGWGMSENKEGWFLYFEVQHAKLSNTTLNVGTLMG